jgi:hypothetical protein
VNEATTTLTRAARNLVFVALFVCEHVRFFCGEALSRRPIVYLRAFSQSAVFRTFHNVLSPALASKHVLIGLTPSKERKQLIKTRLGLSVASLYVVPDEVWQAWVQRELGRAYGVVVDLTVPTDNLAWELAETEKMCRPEQVIRLVRPEDSNSTLPNAEIVVGSSRSQLRSARASLQKWLKRLGGTA